MKKMKQKVRIILFSIFLLYVVIALAFLFFRETIQEVTGLTDFVLSWSIFAVALIAVIAVRQWNR